MPMSPLPNWAVSLAPPPDPIAAVVSLVVVPLSSPQAARKAAIAVELPPTARKRRRDTGSLSCLISAIWRSPPGRLPARPYGERQGVDQNPPMAATATTARTRTRGAALLVLASIVSVQCGAALATTLFGEIGPAGAV